MAISPSQPFAGVGVTDACHEEAEAERQHENVQHGMFLCDVIANATGIARPRSAAFAFDGREVPLRA
jgi:hypothetical protein